jgi:predicted house-cleaning noncanonical NTP pyrophosphatase (MazG superfamily)
VKLVRDNIPEIIKESGRACKFHIADLPEYKAMLFEKLREELQEFAENPCVDEAADMWEVLRTIFWAHDIDRVDVEIYADRKEEERGGFTKGIVLEHVDEDVLDNGG